MAHHQARYWQRIARAVWFLATTGISLQVEFAVNLARMFNITNHESGSIKRLIKETLDEEHHLIERSESIRLVYQEDVLLLQLSERGRELAGALGIPSVESEWQRLRDKHRGDKDTTHAAAVLKFAYLFRERGCRVHVMPEVEGHQKPDLLAIQHGESFYLEVETKPKRDPDKWHAVYERFGVCNVCMLNQKAERAMARHLSAIKNPPVRWMVTYLKYLADPTNDYFLFSDDG